MKSLSSFSLAISIAILGFGSGISLSAQQSSPPGEVIPVGPGYLTRGYKTIVNGQVVQTTDGQVWEMDNSPTPADPAMPPSSTPSPAKSDWPEVVIVRQGIVTDPDTMRPVNHLPANIELIPLGLRRLPDSGEMMQYFRVRSKESTAPTESAAPGTSISAPSVAEIVAEANPKTGPEKTATESSSENASGGWFDFLFGSDDTELAKNELEIDLTQPLTQEEVMALRNDPEFQRLIREKYRDNRNFSTPSRRGTGGRGRANKLPQKITVESFDAENWEQTIEFSGPTPPTPNVSIGKLVSVNPDRKIAVCWLRTRYLRPLQPMVTRNYELEITGVLIPSGTQDGRSAGFWIAEGKPRRGDEVIFPGPEYEKWVQPWLD